jgi:hypothetical protein
MNEQMFDGFKTELAALKEKITSARAELEHLEDGEECAIARHNIFMLEGLLGIVTKVRDALVLAELDAAEAPQKFRRWREAVAKTREAKLALDGFAKPIEETQLQIDQAERSFQVAQDALTDHLNHEIPSRDFVAQATIRKWDTQCTHLQSAVNERSAALRALKGTIAGLRGGWIRATEHFNPCALTERMSRLPMPQKPEGVGTLRAVL